MKDADVICGLDVVGLADTYRSVCVQLLDGYPPRSASVEETAARVERQLEYYMPHAKNLRTRMFFHELVVSHDSMRGVPRATDFDIGGALAFISSRQPEEAEAWRLKCASDHQAAEMLHYASARLRLEPVSQWWYGLRRLGTIACTDRLFG